MTVEHFGIGKFHIVACIKSTLDDSHPDIEGKVLEHYRNLPPNAGKVSQIIEFYANGYYLTPFMPSQEKMFTPYSDPDNRFESVKEVVRSKIAETKERGARLYAIVMQPETDNLHEKLPRLYKLAPPEDALYKSPAGKA